MRVTLIHNPTAGDRIASAGDLRSMLEEAGYRVRVASTKKKWRKALQHKADVVVAAGGDGTARKVALAMAGTGVPVAVLPLGTANNTGKTLGAVGNARAIIESWRDADPRPLDLGVARLESGRGGAGAKRGDRADDEERASDHGSGSGDGRVRFLESAGAGLFAELIRVGPEAVEKEPVFVGRETDRMLLLLAHCAREASVSDWTVEVDGRDCSGRYVAVEALNVRFGGPNVALAPDADTGDGLLDVVLIDEAGRDALLAYARRRLHVGGAELPPVRSERGSHVSIRVPDGVAVHADDRLLEARPLDDAPESPGNDGPAPARTLEITVEAGALCVLGQPADQEE